jgi:hypothetical protein
VGCPGCSQHLVVAGIRLAVPAPAHRAEGR